MAFLVRVCEFGHTFATRARGAELRDTVLARRADEDLVTIDFADVSHVSYSFADEFVAKLAVDGPAVELINMSPTVGLTIRSARERRTGAVTG